MRPSRPLRPRLGDTRPALSWVLALSSLLAGCYSTRRQHVIGDYELPPLEEGDALRVQVSTGSASEYQGRIPVWYLQEAGIAPSTFHEAPLSKEVRRNRERRATAMVGPGEVLADEAPPGWQFQPAIPGANRADVTCDYRLELTNTGLKAAPGMALLYCPG